MQKYGNLFEDICSYDNFQVAYANAVKGKKHYREVIDIEKNRDELLRNLADSVRNKQYRISDYKIFKLWSVNKWREVYKLPMSDRIVLYVICFRSTIGYFSKITNG